MYQTQTTSPIKDIFLPACSPETSRLLGASLRLMLFSRNVRTPVILYCIGTPSLPGDSIGPMVGTILERENLPITVCGSLYHPLHAGNLSEKIRQSYAEHCSRWSHSTEPPVTIAVDASFGAPSQVGMVSLKSHGIFPGLGLKKSLPCVGDFSITGIVGTGSNVYEVLANASEDEMYPYANTIASIIRYGVGTIPFPG